VERLQELAQGGEMNLWSWIAKGALLDLPDGHPTDRNSFCG
jgi:hypothetical protein